MYRAGQVLLIQKSADDPYNPSKWEIPGGRLKGAEGLDEGLKREIKEEVGLDAEIGQPLAIWDWTMGEEPNRKRVVAVTRLCKPVGEKISFESHDTEDFIADWQWVDVSRVPEMDLIPDAREAILNSLRVLVEGELE